jgi:hypothetical protein
MFDNTGRRRSAAEYVSYLGRLLFAVAEQFYEVHMEKAQMRLAPTRRADRQRD